MPAKPKRVWRTPGYTRSLLSGVVGFALGVFFLPRTPLQLDDKINPLQFLTLCLTAGVSVILVRRVEKQKYSDKLKKDVVLDRLKTAIERVSSIEQLCSPDGPKYTDVAARVKRCRTEFKAIIGFARYLGVPIDDARVSGFSKAIDDANNLLTYTPTVGINPDLRVSDGRIWASGPQLTRAIAALDRARSAINGIQAQVILHV